MPTIPIRYIGNEDDILVDRFERHYVYLRLSITDACNFRCNYCLPCGYQPDAESSSHLQLNEIQLLIQAFTTLGIEKVRITGGEPTLRKDFLEIAHHLSSYPTIKQIALTTNGYRMQKDVHLWKQAGISHLNVSVDSLDPRLFHLITGENKLSSILAGIDRAFEIGYRKVKVNAVLLKQYNANQLTDFLHWIRDRPIQLRFIELMQTDSMQHFFHQQHLSGTFILQYLLKQGWQLQQRAFSDGPAKVLTHSDYVGEIGLIMPYETAFCASCNRLRVSSRGKLHLCLFGQEGIELRDLLQSQTQQKALKQRILSALPTKSAQHRLHQGNSGGRQHLASIGG